MSVRIVIQCAATKHSGGYLRTPDGRPVKFVAHPESAPEAESTSFVLAHPDDPSGVGASTWREVAVQYNQQSDNPLGLHLAHQLYAQPAYRDLVRRFGVASVFILSAGWGLIPATFKIPNYDITFSPSADTFKRRLGKDVYRDVHGLSGGDEPIVFLGGKDYLKLFLELTARISARRIVYFNSAHAPRLSGCELVRYQTTQRTNWHYACANDLVTGRLALPA